MTIMKSGTAPTLRYVGRTHAVSISWIAERVRNGECIVEDVNTLYQAADVFTKGFGSREAWLRVVGLIGLLDGRACDALLTRCRGASRTSARGAAVAALRVAGRPEPALSLDQPRQPELGEPLSPQPSSIRPLSPTSSAAGFAATHKQTACAAISALHARTTTATLANLANPR